MLDDGKLEAKLAAGALTWATTAPESGSRAEKRICGTPQPSQKGELSSTAAPHPGQECSTGFDYLRQMASLKAWQH